MNLVSKNFVVTGTLLAMLCCIASCSHKHGHHTLSMPAIPSEPQNEEEYVASYLYAREMFPLQRELVRRDLELRTNWTLMQAQRKGNVHVRAVAQPLQFTGDDAVDMSKTYSVLLIADNIPSDKKFLDVYDVTVGPDPLAAVVREAMSAKSLESTDLAYIQENITRLTIDEGNLDADVAEADATRDLLGKKIGEAISFTNKQIKQTESELNITKGERRKLREQLPGILNRVDNAESAHKKARKRHKQLNNQLVASKIRDFATVALTNNIAGLVQAQGFSDTQQSNDIIDEIKRKTDKENDADEKAKLEGKLEEASTAQKDLSAAIEAYHKARKAVEAATAKSKELSRAETDKKILAKTKESNAEAASKKQKDQKERLEKANAALDVATGGEAVKQRDDLIAAWPEKEAKARLLKDKIDTEKKTLEELKGVKDAADDEVAVALGKVVDAEEEKKPDLRLILEAKKTKAKTAKKSYDEQKKLVDGTTKERDELLRSKEELDALVKDLKDKKAEKEKTQTALEKTQDTANKAKTEAEAARKEATAAKEELAKKNTDVQEKEVKLAEKLLAWETAETTMQSFGSLDQQADAANDRLATAKEMAALQGQKRILTEQIPQILGLRDTHAVQKEFDSAESDLQSKKQELDKVGRELQRYNRDGFLKMMGQRAAIQQAEDDLEELEPELLRLERLQRRPELARIARAANKVLLAFWVKMLERGEKLVGKENYEYAMRTAVMVRFRPQALKNLEQVQIDVLKKKNAGEIKEESSEAVPGGANDAEPRTSPQAAGPADVKYSLAPPDTGTDAGREAITSPPSVPPEDADAAVQPIRDAYWIKHQELLFQKREAEFDREKSACEERPTNSERDNCLNKLDNAETGVRDARKALAKAKNAAKAFRHVTESATHAIKTVEDGLKKIRVTLMMRGSDVDKQSRLDYLEHVSAKIPGAIGTASEARKSVEDQAGVVMVSPKSQPDLSGLLTERGKASEIVNSILGAIHKRDLGATKSTEIIAKIDGLLPELAAYRTWVDGLLAVFNSYNPVKSETGSFKLMETGELAVFRFNVLRGIVSTTAYLLPSDGVRYLYGEEFSKHFYVAKVTLHNPNKKPILVYGNTITMVVRMNSADPGFMGEDGHPRRRSWWATYQPLNYKAVAAMIVSIQKHDLRSVGATVIDLAGLIGAVGSAFTADVDYNRAVAVFNGMFAPAVKEMLMADLVRYQQNFGEFGLQAIEEIEAGGAITRQIFLPKGPIYGDYLYDIEVANAIGQADESGWIRQRHAEKFGERALIPAYIHNIRREEVYVEGKRILVSDPLSPGVR